ncbi:MAG: phosphate ABC transporter permease PstA [Pseudomonadota bacterium]
MTSPAAPSAAPGRLRDEAARRRLSRRRAAERRFKAYGIAAIGVAIGFLILFIFSIGSQAVAAFSQHKVRFDLVLAPEIVSPNGPGDRHAIAENVSGFYRLVREDLAARFPEAAEAGNLRELNDLVTRLAVLPMAREVAENPAQIGQTARLTAALSDDLDLFLKGAIAPEVRARLAEPAQVERLPAAPTTGALFTLTGPGAARPPELTRVLEAAAARTGEAGGFSVFIQSGGAIARLIEPGGETPAEPAIFERLTGDLGALAGARPHLRAVLLPETARNVTDRQIAWALALQDDGRITRRLNWGLLSNADSTYPEIAGVLAALVGSLLTMAITASLAIPVGICAAIYLEEFAPKNRMTDVIEVNINNLAAVPSIVFGLLGAALFLNVLALPRSAPLVGGMVLGLLTLPTVIIASRAALRSVPPSIRSAALGIGASKTQTVMHHVLPLAAPGIMTGAIIGMARALGETAPLLLIGMVAFVAEVPSGPTDEATALPVLIFKWSTGAERAWEPNTAAAIVVLLTFMVVMNAVAVFLRRRFERRW